MIQIPTQEKQFIQANTSDTLGNLWSTFNCDFTSNLGRGRLSPRYLQTTNSTTNANLGLPVAIKFFSGATYCVAGSKVHGNNGTMIGAFTVNAGSSTPTDCDSTLSDMEVFNNTLVVSRGATSISYAATPSSSWTGVSGLSSSTLPHKLLTFGSRLYITDANAKILSYDTSWTLSTSGQYTLNLNSDTSITYQIVWMIKVGSTIWIGTISVNGMPGAVFTWDGSSNNYTNKYTLEEQGTLAGIAKDESVYIITGSGKLMKFNGGAFIEVARLPINLHYLTNSTSFINNRWIHPNGICISDGRINILINNIINNNAGSIYERCPSGIWEYDEKIGLYHKSSLTYTPAGSITVTDYGQNRIYAAGALTNLKIASTASGANGKTMAGATFYTDATTTQSGIWIDDYIDTTQKAGYMVTNVLESSKLTETWQEIDLTWRKFLNSTDTMTLKYRTDWIDPLEVTGTWTSTTTFTTTTNVLDYYPNDGRTQYEVEFLQGVGAGLCAHITNVDFNGTVYTVTIDTTFTGATGTTKVRFQKWIKILTSISSTDTGKFKDIGLGITNPSIQFKLFMVFTGPDELYKIIINSIPQQ